MRTLYYGLVGIAVLVSLGGAVFAQSDSGQVAAGGSTEKVFNMFGTGDMVQAAGDFRKAAEALERFASTLEGIVASLAEGLAESSRNHAAMSESFDPFGFKTAFKTIAEQSKTIERLQKAEIRRLRKQCREMKNGAGKGRKKGTKRK